VRRSEVPVPVLQALNNDKQERGQQVVILVQVGSWGDACQHARPWRQKPHLLACSAWLRA
jgi:hypothetical protein